MARRLLTVEDTFLISGRGLVPVPGLIPEDDELFRVGDPILLKRPDGSSFQWNIGGLEILSGVQRRHDLVILLKGLDKEDVPVGSEIWSVDQV